MHGKSSQLPPVEVPPRRIEPGPSASTIRDHLQQVVASPAFKGSRRSQEFLQYIVAKALHGEVEALKERVLGVELFGRPASYDTSEDAIVRVTASDLRRRLHQHYSAAEQESPVRIELPSGSYLPEFRWTEKRTPTPALEVVPEPVFPALRTSLPPVRRVPVQLAGWVTAAVVFLALVGYVWRDRVMGGPLPNRVQPWATLFDREQNLRLVYCDPDISLIQHLMGFRITLSDYANRRYWPAGLKATQDTQRAVNALRGTKVAFVDSTIAVNIASLAAAAERPVRTHLARSLQLLDFKTDDNFVLLGSPRSNPWFDLFSDKLDFRFENDEATMQEYIVNRNPRAGEERRYLPTALGGGTGQAYAILALVPNPGRRGHVLLIAGSTAEATEGAGSLATNVEHLSTALLEHGIGAGDRPEPFEMLLRVSTMAGSANTFEIIACHRLKR